MRRRKDVNCSMNITMTKFEIENSRRDFDYALYLCNNEKQTKIVCEEWIKKFKDLKIPNDRIYSMFISILHSSRTASILDEKQLEVIRDQMKLLTSK